MNEPFVMSTALVGRLRAQGGPSSARMALDAAIADPGLVTAASFGRSTYLDLAREVTTDAGLSLMRGDDQPGGVFGALGLLLPALVASLELPNAYFPVATGVEPLTYLVAGPGPGPALGIGAGGGVSFPDLAAWDFATAGPWSIDLWLRTDEDPGAPANLVDKSDGTTWPFRLRLLPGGAVEGSHSDGADVTTVQTAAVNDGDWHYLSLLARPGTVAIQVDDAAESTAADLVAGDCSNASPILVGQSTVAFDVADFGVYGLALTTTQRSRHRTATLRTAVTP